MHLTAESTTRCRRSGLTSSRKTGPSIPFVGGPATTYNFGPNNFFQRPSERYTIYGKGHIDVSDNVEAFMDISYTNNVSDAQIAPTASFGGNYSINCDNPFIQNNLGVPLTDVFGCDAAAIAAGTISTGNRMSHRNVEGGPRSSLNENTALRIAAGLRGSFADDVWELGCLRPDLGNPRPGYIHERLRRSESPAGAPGRRRWQWQCRLSGPVGWLCSLQHLPARTSWREPRDAGIHRLSPRDRNRQRRYLAVRLRCHHSGRPRRLWHPDSVRRLRRQRAVWL